MVYITFNYSDSQPNANYHECRIYYSKTFMKETHLKTIN